MSLPAAPPPKFSTQRVTAIERRTPTLVNFSTTRDPDFRFTPGHYARLGLGTDDVQVWRPYSIASAAGADRLDFQFTLVPGGAFSELFAQLAVGDAIRVDVRSFGFLTIDQLAPGGTLWLLSTGTGLAPFVSILMHDQTWQHHARVVLVHSVRRAAELMSDVVEAALAARTPEERARFAYIPVVTRENAPGALAARLGELLRSGALEQAGGAALDAQRSRAMLCGNPEMIKEMRALLKERGMQAGRRGVPGQIAAEGYW
jgi:ferredoxin--NADP+ reductase